MSGAINILIAGGNGTIGKHLELFLIQRKLNIKILTRNKST
jgi:nucleoside-diphosphate-sugar epimerase